MACTLPSCQSKENVPLHHLLGEAPAMISGTQVGPVGDLLGLCETRFRHQSPAVGPQKNGHAGAMVPSPICEERPGNVRYSVTGEPGDCFLFFILFIPSYINMPLYL